MPPSYPGLVQGVPMPCLHNGPRHYTQTLRDNITRCVCVWQACDIHLWLMDFILQNHQYFYPNWGHGSTTYSTHQCVLTLFTVCAHIYVCSGSSLCKLINTFACTHQSTRKTHNSVYMPMYIRTRSCSIFTLAKMDILADDDNDNDSGWCQGEHLIWCDQILVTVFTMFSLLVLWSLWHIIPVILSSCVGE